MSLDRLIAKADPAIGRPPTRADSPEAHAALDAILEGRAGPAPRSRPLTRRLVAMVAVAAVVIAASVLAIVPGALPPSGSAAAATLSRLSRVAAAQPALVAMGPGQYYFTSYEYPQVVSVNGGCAVAHCATAASIFTVRYEYVEQFWVRPGGLVHIRVTRRSPKLVPATRAGWIASGRPSVARLLPRTFNEIVRPTPLGASPASALLAVQHLPTTPAALAAALDAGPLGGPTHDAQNMFNALAVILDTGGASPVLRSEVFKVLATIPGVTDLGVVRDPLGRRGVAFKVAAAQRYACTATTCPVSAVIIDPATGELLAEASWNSHGPSAWTTYLSMGIANTIGSLPAGGGK